MLSKRYQFQISAFTTIFIAALLLMLPLQWIGAMLIAIAVHECSHGIAIYLLGGNIIRIYIGGRGVRWP